MFSVCSTLGVDRNSAIFETVNIWYTLLTMAQNPAYLLYKRLPVDRYRLWPVSKVQTLEVRSLYTDDSSEYILVLGKTMGNARCR